MVEYSDLVVLIDSFGEPKHVKISLALLRVLGGSNIPDFDKAACILAYCEHSLFSELLEKDSTEEQTSLRVEEILNRISRTSESDPKAARVFCQVDIHKVLKLAAGLMSFREFSVYCAIGSSVGDAPARVVTQSVIAARAAGYVKPADVPNGVPLLNRHQVACTVRQLAKREMIFYLSPSKRATYYSGWKLHSGHSKEAGKEEFGRCVARMHKRGLKETTKTIRQAFDAESDRTTAPAQKSARESRANGRVKTGIEILKAYAGNDSKPKTQTDVYLEDIRKHVAMSREELLRVKALIGGAILNGKQTEIRSLIDNLNQAQKDGRLGTKPGIHDPLEFVCKSLHALRPQ